MAKETDLIAQVQKQELSNMKWLRFSLALIAVIVSAANLFGSINAESSAIMFWLDFEASAYITIALVYLLGLKSWYKPAILFSILNIFLFFISSIIVIRFITTQLTGNLSFFNYNYGQIFALFGWIYLIVVGLIVYKIDRGSQLDKILTKNIV